MNERHSMQETPMRFYTAEEHNEVIKHLRLLLGKKADRLVFDGRNAVIYGEKYQERSYYLVEENECVFDEMGNCIEHKSIKNILAHGFIPTQSSSGKGWII